MAAKSLDVDWEAIRVLALSHGLEVAAQQSGINLNAVKARSARKNWFARDAGTIATNATKAGDAHLDILAEMESETRISLAKASRRMAKDCEELPVRHAGLANTVAKTMAIVHRQGDQAQAGFSLNVLNLGQLQIGVAQSSEHDTSAE